MKVKNLKTNEVVEATKINETTYRVEGKDIAKDEMGKLYEIVKTVPKTITKIETVEVTIANSSMGGDIGGLAEGLSKCQGEFRSVGKNAEGHGYNFSDFQSVVEASTPILSKHGLAVTQVLITKMIGDIHMSGVKTLLIHKSGGWMSGETYIPTTKTKMNSLVQMFGVNTSYLKRYGWLAICGLSTTEKDTDGVG